jgi:hypothetical protein
MNEQQALEVLTEMLNKAAKRDVYNIAELYSINVAFKVLGTSKNETEENGVTDKEQTEQ